MQKKEVLNYDTQTIKSISRTEPFNSFDQQIDWEIKI